MSHMFGTAHRRGALTLLCAAMLVPAVAEAQRVEGSFQRSLSVAGAPSIDVVSGSGRIEVRPGSANRVEVSARIVADDGWGSRRALPAAERVRRLEANPPIEQSGNVVRIGHINDEDLRNDVSISYTLTVPAASSIVASTGSGSQHIEGINGNVKATSGSGSLTCRTVGGDLRAATGSGSISVDGVRGAFHATTGSGEILATGLAGRITSTTGSGEIDLTQTGSGSVNVSTGSGSIHVRGANGPVDASTASGSLQIQGRMSDDWSLSSASGRITIDLPSNQGFELDARTGSGRIQSDFPLTISGVVDRRSLRGATQGGGRLLRVRTSSGGITLRRS